MMSSARLTFESAPSNSIIEPDLPRLMYIGDVAVTSTVAGSALLFRVLQKYPVARLRIVEGNLQPSRREMRLPGATYETLPVGSRRLLNSRLHSRYSVYLHLSAKSRASKLEESVADFKPEAILTVAHGSCWLTAAEIARKFNLPLHLIIHDDWVSVQRTTIPTFFATWIDKQFGKVYRQAKSRLCASPYMVEAFERRYRVRGSVLYPSRSPDIKDYTQPPDLARQHPVFAFAGTVNTRGYLSLLESLSAALEPTGGKLLVHSNLTPEDVRDSALDNKHTAMRPLLPIKELLEQLRKDADILFVPMSFDLEDRLNMESAFPSKIADYTAIGLPLLIWGPPTCSAVRWARENKGVAVVVDHPEVEALISSTGKLLKDAEYRKALSFAAIKAGKEFFAHAHALERFYRSIT